MAKIIVPVGFDGGPIWELDSSGAATDRVTFEILKPAETVEVSRDDYRIWLLSYADPAAASRGEFGRAELENLAAREVRAEQDTAAVDVPSVIETLVKWGVLAEYDPFDTSGIEFLQAYRLFPAADAMGNTREDPGLFRIGREGRVLLGVVWDIYAVWTSSGHSPSLWHAVNEYFEEIDEPLFGLEEMARLMAAAVPGIVTNRCGYLQAVR